MTRQQAEQVAQFIQNRLDGRKLWSITVSETKKAHADAPTKYRVLITPLGSGIPLAIYSAHILRKPVGTVEQGYALGR